jgi:hypothetical protein
LKETKNKIPIHINSSTVDWGITYSIPIIGEVILFDELLSRIPDLEKDYLNIKKVPKYICE